MDKNLQVWLMAVIAITLVCLLGCFVTYILQTRHLKRRLKEKDEEKRSFEAMSMLFRYIITGQGVIDTHFERIDPKRFIYAVRDVLVKRFMETFRQLEVHNDLCDIYKQGPNWESLKQQIIYVMNIELAMELYLHYLALEINNAFKMKHHEPEDRIRIAKEIALEVIIGENKNNKKEKFLSETAEKIIQKFDLGPERKTVFMAEVIKIQNGITV